ncbi:MAG TPA: hypothetical protein VJZ25_09015 [Gemmatimonadaceae bacterium]|nr:hypothetical protein [Gemmatimonadaceae bacterium]
MSTEQHSLEQTMDVLVLVKAYPQPSVKYTESVCVAGLRLDTPEPEWVRLYPVQFRLLARERQFSKYDVIRCRARRPRSDSRGESFTPHTDTIEKIGHIGHERGWAARIPFIEKVRVASMCELCRRQEEDGTSLGVFQPQELTGFEITPTSPEWDAGRQAALGQGNLLCSTPKLPLEKVPFDFHYSFMCDDPACGGHRMSMIDWELGANYRRTAGLPEEERLRLVMECWRDRVCGPNRDTHFFAGNLAKRQNQFVLLGAFWPPKPKISVRPKPQELALF